MTKPTTKVADIDWAGIEHSVREKLAVLRGCWQGTEQEAPPEFHARLVRDLYLPALGHLAAFCEAVEIHDAEG